MGMQIIALAGSSGGEVDTLGNANTYIAVNTGTNTITLVVSGTTQAVWS